MHFITRTVLRAPQGRGGREEDVRIGDTRVNDKDQE